MRACVIYVCVSIVLLVKDGDLTQYVLPSNFGKTKYNRPRQHNGNDQKSVQQKQSPPTICMQRLDVSPLCMLYAQKFN